MVRADPVPANRSEAGRKAWKRARDKAHEKGFADGRAEGLADGHLKGRDEGRVTLVRAILALRGIGVSPGFPSPRQRAALTDASDDVVARAALGATSEADFTARLD